MANAFNIVRMRVKPEFVDEYLAFHRDRDLREMKDLTSLKIIRTGERDFCFIGEWRSMDALAAARPAMIAILDGFRDKLEDLGGGLGITDPVSGEVVVERSG
jgi:hypothetical protein